MAASRKLRLKEKRRRTRMVLSIAASFVVLTLSGVLLYALYRPEISISSVSVSETYYADRALIERMVYGMLEGKYFFLVPRSNVFFYPKTSIERDLYGIFPSIKEAVLTRVGFKEISIVVTERFPDALWCPSVGSDEVSPPCYFMDEEGFIFFKPEDNEARLRTYVGAVNEGPLRQTFFNGNYAHLKNFVDDIGRATERTPTTVAVDEHEDISVFFSEGGELRFAYKNADDALLENIESVFASRKLNSDEVLEYADFRFGNKIYVKFVGE